MIAVVASPASARNGGGRRQAILTGGREAVRMLLDKGADAGAATPRGVTPLHLAAWDDTRDLAELLVSAGADPAAKDSRDRTAADYAKQRGQKGVLKVLAKKAR